MVKEYLEKVNEVYGTKGVFGLQEVIIDQNPVSTRQVVDVSRRCANVSFSDYSKKKVDKSRSLVEEYLAKDKREYGITTGFGKFSDIIIPKADQIKLQRNLIVSHACGVGEPFEEEVVRGMMFLRAVALSKGNSGVRQELINLLLDMLSKGVHPVVYQKGSLGASGDLIPLAHIALVMIGEGEAVINGEKMPGGDALKKVGLKPIVLNEKEGLALINGTQAMTSVGSLAVEDSKRILQSADVISAMSFEALRGIDDVFSSLVSSVRPHKGHRETSENMRKLLEGSKLVSKKQELRVQDAYTLRCIPQVHGASRDAVGYVQNVINTEINSVTDNPLIFPEQETIISAGNFHGQPVAIAMDFLSIAIAEMGNISERRIERLVNYQLNDLPPFLTEKGGLNSGFMIPQYAAASLVSENKSLAHPASVDSIPSSANQEDHVSMGAIAARKAMSIIENTFDVLAIEYLAACQALEFRGVENASKSTKNAYKLLRKDVSPLDDDRVFYEDIRKVKEIIKSGKLVK